MAIRFNGSAYLQRDNDVLDYNQNYSLLAWLYLIGSGTTQGLFYLTQTAGSFNYRDTLALNSSNQLAIDIRNGAGTYTATGATALTGGTWAHIALVRSETTALTDPNARLTVYLNGVQEATLTRTLNNRPAGSRTFAGFFPNTGYLNGRLFALKLWQRALSAAEIAAEMKAVHPLSMSSLFAFYPTNTGAADRLRDYSSFDRLWTATGTLSDEDNAPGVAYQPIHPPALGRNAAPPPSLPARWKVVVDWDGDGDFSDPLEDITADVQSLAWRAGMRAPYQQIADETGATLKVVNAGGKYAPENAASPLAGFLRPNRRLQIIFVDTAQVEHPLYTGWLDLPLVEWEPAGAPTGQITARLEATGAKARLQAARVTLPLYQNVSGDVIVRAALEQAQIPPAAPQVWQLDYSGYSALGFTTRLGNLNDYAQLDTGTGRFPVYGEGEPLTALDVIEEITAAERGRFFFDRAGRAVWWNRHHLLAPLTPVAAVHSQSGPFKPVALDYSYGKDIVNVVRVQSNPRRTATSEILWQLDAPLTVAAGATLTLFARLRKGSGQFAGALELLATPTFAAGNATVTITPQGGLAEITVHNADPHAPAILSALTLTGAPTLTQHQMVIEARDESSLTAYGRRTLQIDLGPVGDFAGADGVARFELARRARARGAVAALTFRRQADGVANAALYTWQIGDRLTLTLPEMSHTQDYFITGEAHRWSPGSANGVHEATFYLEPADSLVFWVLGAAGYSELAGTTRLAV